MERRLNSADTARSMRIMLFVAAVLLMVPAHALSTRPSRVRNAMPLHLGVVSRRAILPLPLALLAVPEHAQALLCNCPAGPESCVCVDAEALGKEPIKNKKRADAAGRDQLQSKAERDYWNQIAADAEARERGETPRAKPGEDRRDVLAEKRKRAQSVPARELSESPAQVPTDPGFLGLTGGSSQNMNEVDKDSAKSRFRAIVMETARKREAEYGFELDASDIKQIESVLRPKYCGPQGLIGPC